MAKRDPVRLALFISHWGCVGCAKNLTVAAQVVACVGLIPSLVQWIKDLALLWLWRRPAAAVLI